MHRVTTSEHLSPSGSALLPKTQEPESDPTNYPHAVLLSQPEQGQEVTSMEQNDKDTLEAEKEQMNSETEEVSQETTASEELANRSENNSDRNEEEISVNKADTNEEEEKEEDGSADDFQTSVEMSGQEYERDKNNRPVCRYNTVCYRKIKKGNTMQRIDEFESMLNV